MAVFRNVAIVLCILKYLNDYDNIYSGINIMIITTCLICERKCNCKPEFLKHHENKLNYMIPKSGGVFVSLFVQLNVGCWILCS